MINKVNEEDFLPKHYVKANEPHFEGKGNHNVNRLEEICMDYKEFVHQQRIIQQRLMEKYNNLVDKLNDLK